MKIVFAGTPDFAVPPLEGLIEAHHRPVAVYTQPDRPAGRGRKLTASPVKQVAIQAGIQVQQPLNFKNEDAIKTLHSLQPDLMIVVAYGLILPAEVLEIPKHGCWNIHASLLPRWRGAAPIQRAIEAGDEETGVCIMQMDEGLDTGPVLHRKSLRISPDETGGSLHDKLAVAGKEALLNCCHQLTAGTLGPAKAQANAGVTYASKLNKNEAEIDWTQPAITLERRIRAFNPWPVAWCHIGDERTRIWEAKDTGQPCLGRPGDVLSTSNDGILIATGEGALNLARLQRPGGRQISAGDYLNSEQALPRNLCET